ncbi:unnamed protein product, partial [marine sediment metagenome]
MTVNCYMCDDPLDRQIFIMPIKGSTESVNICETCHVWCGWTQ